MLQFYKLYCKKLDSSLAMYFFLLTNIAFWFLTGTLAGLIFALYFLNNTLILSCAFTSGAFLALTIGYVYGCIIVIRNS